MSHFNSKFFRDITTVLEMKLLFLIRGWYWYVIRALVVPIGVFFWLGSIAPDDPIAIRRIMAGAIIFSVSLMTANMLAQQMLLDRFLGRLKLVITMPVSKIAYSLGILLFATIQAVPIVVLLICIAKLASVDFVLNITLFPLLVAVLFAMSGITLIIVSYAPSIEIGGIASNLFGMGFIIMSPVFFSLDRAPIVLQWFGMISPMRYAADGLIKALSGRNDIWTELLVISSFGIITLIFGLWKLKWREA